MGTFEKNEFSKIVTHRSKKGDLLDLLGRRCNEKGYLTDGQGNIVDT